MHTSFDELFNAIRHSRGGVYISGWSQDSRQNSKELIANKQFIKRSDIELYDGLTERYNVHTNKYERMPRRISFRGVETSQLFVPLGGSVFPTGGRTAVSFEEKDGDIIIQDSDGSFSVIHALTKNINLCYQIDVEQ